MADYHILDGSADGNNYRIIFHIPVPDEDNEAGINLRTALSETFGGDMVSAVPANRLGAGEQDALNSGELYEHSYSYNTNPDVTLLQKRDELDAKFSSFSTSIPNELQKRLAYWGYGRDVP